MKKIVLLGFLIGLAFCGFAQTQPFGTGAAINVSPGTVTHVHGIPDTLINADTVTHTITASAGYSSITISPVLTKASGTVAGKARIYGSVDNVNFDQLDSMTFADVATQYHTTFLINGAEYSHYKVVYITSGTVAVLPKTWYILR